MRCTSTFDSAKRLKYHLLDVHSPNFIKEAKAPWGPGQGDDVESPLTQIKRQRLGTDDEPAVKDECRFINETVETPGLGRSTDRPTLSGWDEKGRLLSPIDSDGKAWCEFEYQTVETFEFNPTAQEKSTPGTLPPAHELDRGKSVSSASLDGFSPIQPTVDRANSGTITPALSISSAFQRVDPRLFEKEDYSDSHSSNLVC
jgi:hypothetical protein